MKHTIKHKDANVIIESLDTGKNRVYVESKKKNLFIPYNNCKTSYDINLIKEILCVKGPAYLCDEIMRDESSDYLQKSLKYSLLSYVSKTAFANKRILDFGCGSGSSTMILRRMFPDSHIVGIELEEKSLKLAKLRSTYYGFNNIEFLLSPDADSLPENIGTFDYILLSAVFEHLLPEERKKLLPKIWKLLKPNGVLFINRTPYRFFPVEIHTTGGLPLINYLPDKLSLWYARRFSKKNLQHDTWELLLRKGIRGGSVKEILNILNKKQDKATLPKLAKLAKLPKLAKLLKPSKLGVKDRVDLWYLETNKTKSRLIKKLIFLLLKSFKIITNISIVPSLSLAIKKNK